MDKSRMQFDGNAFSNAVWKQIQKPPSYFWELEYKLNLLDFVQQIKR